MKRSLIFSDPIVELSVNGIQLMRLIKSVELYKATKLYIQIAFFYIQLRYAYKNGLVLIKNSFYNIKNSFIYQLTYAKNKDR